ncbi:CapA family protein [Paenibacillus sp. YYML68]|uniref:CapA family protein n=1 Tax=Paenibacillus sp. YYML68 TaxID=2909250 RepID=UPI002492F602|nr:CapA family protein [Paenibacillus sp. YYML68]
MLWIKLGTLALLTVAAFFYLNDKLSTRTGQQQNGNVPSDARGQDRADQGQPPAAAPKGAPSSEGGAGTSGQGSGSTQGSGEPQTGTATGQQPPAVPQAQQVKLAFVGDVMFAGKVDDLVVKHGYDYPFKYVKTLLEAADITAANLETPITTRGDAQTKEYVYRSSPNVLPELTKAGIDLVNLANNHSMDYGKEGLLDTLRHLDEHGVLRVGAGVDADEAYGYTIVEKQGMKLAYIGTSHVLPAVSWLSGKGKPGISVPHTSKQVLESIAKARQEADLVIVVAHWGEERKPYPVKEQTELAHAFIDAGADLIIGSHPHVLQGFEQYKGKWIAYSLGNFIFTTNEVPETWESMILEASCTKERSCQLHVTPIITKWAQPIRMVEDKGQQLLEKLGRISVNAQLSTDGKVSVGPVRKLEVDVETNKKQNVK